MKKAYFVIGHVLSHTCATISAPTKESGRVLIGNPCEPLSILATGLDTPTPGFLEQLILHDEPEGHLQIDYHLV